MLSIVFFLMPINESLAYWKANNMVENVNSSETLVIGRWYFFDPAEANAPEVVTFDFNNPPDKNIEAGSIIVYKDENGLLTIYKSLKKNHVPTKNTMQSPLETNYWQEVLLPNEISFSDLWYRQKIYYEGEQVKYKGKKYEAILSGRAGFLPTDKAVWKEVN